MAGRAWISSSDITARLVSTNPRGDGLSEPLKELLAEKACEWIEREAAIRVLADPANPYRRRFKGHGKSRLHLPYQPVNSIASLSVNGSTIPVGTSTQFAANQVSAYFDEISVIYPSRFPRCDWENVFVEWTAGYAYEDVPQSIRSLAEAVAMIMFKERERWGDQQRVLPGQTVIYVREIPPAERLTLDGLKDRRHYFSGIAGVPA